MRTPAHRAADAAGNLHSASVDWEGFYGTEPGSRVCDGVVRRYLQWLYQDVAWRLFARRPQLNQPLPHAGDRHRCGHELRVSEACATAHSGSVRLTTRPGTHGNLATEADAVRTGN